MVKITKQLISSKHKMMKSEAILSNLGKGSKHIYERAGMLKAKFSLDMEI